MIDPFVLLAPVLLLAVVALLRFVGCNQVFGLNPTTLAPSPPVLSDISPMFETERDPGFTLIVTGGNFVNGTPGMQSVVQWNGSNRDTAFKSATELWAAITAADIATPGTTTVTVFTPDASPDTTSNGKTFTINSSDVAVTFSGPEPTTLPGGPPAAPPGTPYKNLVFDANWAWERTTPENNLSHVYLVPGQTSGSFTFFNGPKLLKSMNVSANPTGTITVSSDNSLNLPVSQPIPITTGQSVPVPINWTQKSTTVTVSFTVQNSIGIDTITYQGPP
jgi:hypothetical protein